MLGKDDLPFKSGQRLNAADLNEIVRQIRQHGPFKLTASSPLDIQYFSGTAHIRWIGEGDGFWAKLKAINYTDKVYSWWACSVDEDTGLLTANEDLGSGDKDADFGWAKETTAWEFAPVDTDRSFVWLKPEGKNYVFDWQRKEAFGKKTSGSITKGSSGTLTVYDSALVTTAQSVTVSATFAAVVTNKWQRIWWEGSSIYCVPLEC